MRLYRSVAALRDERRCARVRPKAQDRASLKEFSRSAACRAAWRCGAVAHPVDIVVRSAEARVRSKTLCCHVAGHAFPDGSFRRLADGLYVASPELVFLQMAQYLNGINLAVLGFELCGCYAVSVDPSSFDIRALFEMFDLERCGAGGRPGFGAIQERSEGFEQVSSPLSSVSRLKRYLNRADGASGVAKARWALDHVIANSASPMESLLALRFVLPGSSGGWGLPHPEMNGKVSISQRASMSYGRRYRVCDLLWRAEGVAVEYDSDAFHVGGRKIAEDSARRSELMHSGVLVLTMTSRSFYDYAAFDAQAHVLTKMLRRRGRSHVRDLDQRRRALHHCLTKGCAALGDDLCPTYEGWA